ncbi:MAG: DUF4091 domain-containing protein [Candidatus Omnitrophica bacterium]|nr:DUF4091 domain-containing protein [Candidatus Omnitrophota bacterium]
MKKIYILVYLLFFLILKSENRATVIKPIKLDFSRYGIISDTYDVEQIISMNLEIEKKISESIDNSLLLIFGEQVKEDVFDKIFSSSIIKLSIKSLLKRGGAIFWGPTSWDILVRIPKNMKDFFKEIGAHLITIENYKGETPDYYYTGIGNPDFEHPFITTPNDLRKLSKKWQGANSIRYFDKLPENCKVLLIDKDKKVPLMIIQENILTNGKIINSYCYSIMRSAEDAFWENLIINLYGKREKISKREVVESKLFGGNIISLTEKENTEEYKVIYPKKAKKSPVIDGICEEIWNIVDWVELVESKEGKVPKKKTWVKIIYDDENFYVFYKCEEPNPSNLKTLTKIRDGEVWNDDSVELFLKTEENLYHFIVNAEGVTYDAKNQNSHWNPEYKISTRKGDEYWTVELQIPFEILETNIEKSPVIKIGLCRNEQQLKEYSSLLPAPKGFYDPNSWGFLSFISENAFLSYLRNKKYEKKKLLYEGGYLIWYDNPYKTKYSNTLPEKMEEIKNLKIILAKNEKECSNILITNFTDDNLIFRIEPDIDGVKDQKGKIYDFYQIVTLKESIARLNPYKERQFDPLVKLNEGNIISVPPYETKQIWLDIKGELPSGKYNTSISFVPVNNLFKEKKVDLEIEIVNFEFPKKLPIIGYAYGPYDMTWAKNKRSAYFAVCPEYHLSYVMLYFPLNAIKKDEKGKIYISNDKKDYFRWFVDEITGKEIIEEKLALKYVEGWFYSYGIYLEFNRRLVSLGLPLKKDTVYYEVDISKEEWEKLFKEWLYKWFTFLKEENIDFKKFFIPLLDEPRDFIADKLFEVGKIIKEIEPNCQITLNPATWTSFELIEKLNPVVDLWVPWEVRLISRGDISKKELEFYQKNEKMFATYLCSPSGIILPLISYYRLRGIRAYLMKTSGIILWGFNSWRGNDWNEFDDKEIDYHLFYHGDKGPIPSIRAESFREGFEDYYILLSVEKKLKEKYVDEIAKLISREHLERLIKEENADLILEWREKLLKFLGES